MIEFIQANWEKIAIIAFAIHTCLKAIRDAIDSTPDTDDNWFEKAVSFIGKIIGYIFGKRSF